ncbi:hypothetical protein [Dermatobacter hominis]|uniref:hypothetical protein n=1 Tax=Dermatobacter hominis TaxID=2884263 RepID=UPI001D0FEC91|nr:hypothetical protein [Dermatobacter hominis]UDY37606.1 hypothetical protein LH044_08715 [Dermatobacter hominis]
MFRTWRPRTGVVVAVIALVVTLVACSPASPPVGGVPGQYTFHQAPILGPSGLFYGPVSGTATVCVTTRTALQIEQISGFGGGFVTIEFDGTSQSNALLFAPWTTEPVGPSCGVLRVAQGPGFVDPSGTLTITVSVSAG